MDVARTKPELDREQKYEEILSTARARFLAEGYEATSMGRIAEQAGVAPNTLYWYFADKDALLLAVLNRLLEEGLRSFEAKKRASLADQLLWLLGLFDASQGLFATVHARVQQSEPVRVWHDNFHLLFGALLEGQLAAHGVEERHLKHGVKIAMLVVEGLVTHPAAPADRAALVRWVVTSLTPFCGPPARDAKARDRKPTTPRRAQAASRG